MQTSVHTLSHYDGTTIRLHWITAGMVLALWCLGESIDWFPRGIPRILARSVHISVGVLLALVLGYRIYWRLTKGMRLPAAGAGMLDQLARMVHLLLYVGLIGALLLGLANTWVRGDSLFNLFKLPAFDPTNPALRERVEDFHALLANLVLILAGLHALAGLVHHYLFKDGVLRRMLPGWGR